MTAATGLLAALSGSLIGLILGLVGGRGSILAVPLLISVVGIGSTHAAIGTGAIAVALNAAIGLAAYWRAGTIRRGCASVPAAAGVVGAAPGAELGKAVPGERLLGLFGLLMAAVGLAMLRPRRAGDDRATHLTRGTAGRRLPRLAGFGLGVGLLAGFLGNGGAAPGVGLGGRLARIRGALEGVFAVMVLLTGLRLAWGLAG